MLAARQPGAAAGVTLLVLLLALVVAPAPIAQAQVTQAGAGPVLTRQVQESLKRLQETWFQWTGSLYGDEEEEAAAVVENMVAIAQELGMEGLPDMSSGALQQAVEAAKNGEPERARLALEAAERLAPGRPETEFAKAEVARLTGDFAGRITAQVRGYLLAFGTDELKGPMLADLVLWILVSLLISAALYVALLMFARGRSVINGLGLGLARRLPFLPGPVIQILLLVVLLAPLALPWGPVWLALYWSLLLWRPALPGERTVLVALWLVVALTPVMVGEMRVRVEQNLSSPVRAMECVIDRQLYGDLFKDLGTLAATLPDSVAVDQFLGDFHARLGQWEVARQSYEAVLDREPENVSALIDLGAYYFERGDYSNAVQRFQQAVTHDPGSAIGYFNLSRAYAASYYYDEAREALVEARRVDDLQVTAWIGRSEDDSIVTSGGGLARKGEIEAALSEGWESDQDASVSEQMVQRLRPAAIFAGLMVGAFVLLSVLRRFGGGAAPVGSLPPPSATRREGGDWRRFIPGLSSATQGRGIRAFIGLFLPACLLTALAVAVGRGFSYPVPWRYDPGNWLLLSVSVVGLVSIVAVRTFRALRSGS